jgi:UDP-N-acetylmuramyl pentapeptide phosphotransferase/UDP-N-acetylglucosamine-1-phosphate transferase
MTINEPSTVREAPAEWVHRLSLRLLLLAAALLVVGVGFLLWNSWDLTGGRKGSTLA